MFDWYLKFQRNFAFTKLFITVSVNVFFNMIYLSQYLWSTYSWLHLGLLFL